MEKNAGTVAGPHMLGRAGQGTKPHDGPRGGVLSQFFCLFRCSALRCLVCMSVIYTTTRQKHRRRNRPAKCLATCMNGQHSSHVPTPAVVYLGISPPPDSSTSLVPQIFSLPTRRLANYSPQDAGHET